MRFTILSSTTALAICVLSTGLRGVSAAPIADALEIRGTTPTEFDVLAARMIADELSEMDARDFDLDEFLKSREFLDVVDSLGERDFDFELDVRAPEPRRGGGRTAPVKSGVGAFGSVLKAGAQAWANHRASQGRPSKVGAALQIAGAFNQARKGRA
ncbi:hypothetical protein NMY22_g3727 [Coprinellus aureogranulatus]|nr:hypothetical protein NMY22_g3727 [Coprinellus aureogranulatus]